MRCHSAADGQNALCGSHPLNVLRRCFKTDKNYLFPLCGALLRVERRKRYAARCSAGRGGEACPHDYCLFARLIVKLRVKKRVKLLRVEHENGVLFGNHTLVDEVARDFESRRGGAFSVSRLEHKELCVLNRKLHVLHVAVVLFKLVAYLNKFVIDGGHNLRQLVNRLRRADSGDDVLALCIHQKFAEKLIFARCGVSCKRHSRA